MSETGDEGERSEGDRFDKFTVRARQVLTFAQAEAQGHNHNYIGTEHLLLGLVRVAEGGAAWEGVAVQVLTNLGVELDNVRGAVEFIIRHGERMIGGEVGLTPRAKKVIELAVDEARRLGHHYIGTEHLLLGLIREGEGIGAKVLENLGVTLEEARIQTERVLAQSGNWPPDARPVARWPRLHSAGWSYLLVTVEHSAAGAGAVTAIEGGEAGVVEMAAGHPPLGDVLPALGAQGWELVAVDRPAAGSALYIFKRQGAAPRRQSS